MASEDEKLEFPFGMAVASEITGDDWFYMANKVGVSKAANWNTAKQYLDITGELIDPIPAGTSGSPAVIPAGPAGQKRKFEPAPGFYQGFPEVTADHRWQFYWNGSTWSLIDMGELPSPVVNQVLNPVREEVASEKATANYIDGAVLTRVPVLPNQLSGKWPYKSDTVGKLRTEYLAYGDAASLITLIFPFNFRGSDKVEIRFESIYSDRIVFVNNGRMVTSQYILTANDKILKRAFVAVPKGTQTIELAVSSVDIPKTSVTVLTTNSVRNTNDYSYLSFDNLLSRVTVENGKMLMYPNNIVVGGVGANLIQDMPIKPVKLEMYGINITNNGAIIFKDVDKKIIKTLTRADLVYNVRSDDPTKWDMRTTIVPPVDAAYVSFSTDLNYYSGLNSTDIYNAPIDKAVIWQEVDVPKTEVQKIKTFKNNLKGQVNVAGRIGQPNTAISTRTKKILIKNESEKNVGRLAFRFRINEDLNIGSPTEKKLVELISADGSKHFNFVANLAATSQLSGSDASAYPAAVTSYYPIPKFNSGFGVRTNLATVAESRRNLNYANRSLMMGVGTNKHYKPICGHDIFYVRFKSEDQTVLIQWSDLRLKTDDLGITLYSVNNGLSVQSLYASFEDMIELYRDFKAQVLASAVGEHIEFYAYNLGSFVPTDTNNKNRSVNSDLYINPNDVLGMDVPLVSQYYNIKTATNLWDGFPAYVSRKIDRSWHTFEMISPINSNTALFTIDGQWFSDAPGIDFPGIRSVWEKGGSIIIGSELAIDIKDLTVEFDVISDAEVMDSGLVAQVFASDYHPNVLHFFGHDLYHLEDQDITIQTFNRYQQYVSEGGFIPDELKPADPLYKGDDGPIPIYRKHLSHPSFKLEQLFTWLKNAGYINITHKELAAWQHEGRPLPSNKCYMIDFDDTPTYIYEDLQLRNIFKRYHCRPAFALELGFYVDSSITTSYNSAAFIAECKDNDEHRLELQKRVHNMQLEGWDIVIHGGKEGLFHNGMTYKEYVSQISEAQHIANKLGFDSQYWCLSSSGSTPNSVKLHEHFGVLISTSTTDAYPSLCNHPNYSARIAWETLNTRQPHTQLSRIIGDNIK